MKFKNNKGITLVALVITVIILLILAGVAISLITGEINIFKSTKLAAEKYNNAAKDEATLLNEINNKYFVIQPNTPKLSEGMTPVKWISDTEIPEETTSTDINWYNYSNKQWANAKTADGSLWVWIPRFEYKITYANELDRAQGGIIDVKFIDTNQVVADEGYKIHPAFINGTKNNFENGEWDKEIPGFWVAKFEAGYAGGGKNDINNDIAVKDSGLKYSGDYYLPATNYYGTITPGTTTMKYPVFSGKTFSYNYINIGDSYRLSKILTQTGNPYGLTNNTDSHLMKSSEWGAVAYLNYSQYGVNGQNEIYINNVNLNAKTGNANAVTGYAGANVDANVNLFSTSPTSLENELNNGTIKSYAWFTKNGQKSSGNNNITGVYDMSGGLWERTTAYIANGSTSLNLYASSFATSTVSTKYTTIYPYNTSSDTEVNNRTNFKNNFRESRYGDIISETSSLDNTESGWNGDYSVFPDTNNPFFNFGGCYNNETKPGSLAFARTYGDSNAIFGFRAVLIN